MVCETLLFLFGRSSLIGTSGDISCLMTGDGPVSSLIMLDVKEAESSRFTGIAGGAAFGAKTVDVGTIGAVGVDGTLVCLTIVVGLLACLS